MLIKFFLALSFILLFTSNVFALETPSLKISGFLDTYYAYDFNRPNPPERQYTTQPARHNEFNINLAMITMEAEKNNSRGKFTLQHGTSVVKNYSSEPRNGSTSGPSDAQMLQEAYVGHKLGNQTWVDGGIYLGHIGMESWISKDNWTYTRSLMSDYVPYYQTGLRLTHNFDANNILQFHVINGWQIISENNQDKSLGLNYTHHFSFETSFIYNNWIGNEKAPLNSKSTIRTYQNFIFMHKFSPRFEIKGCADIGSQDRQNREGFNIWTAYGLISRYQLAEHQFMALRGEYFHDKDQSNASTLTPNGFKTFGFSLNYDKIFDEGALIRIEYRRFFSKDAVYPEKNTLSKKDAFIVASLGLSL